MPHLRKLFKSGNSVVLAIPQDILDHLGLQAGESVMISRQGPLKITVKALTHKHLREKK